MAKDQGSIAFVRSRHSSGPIAPAARIGAVRSVGFGRAVTLRQQTHLRSARLPSKSSARLACPAQRPSERSGASHPPALAQKFSARGQFAAFAWGPRADTPSREPTEPTPHSIRLDSTRSAGLLLFRLRVALTRTLLGNASVQAPYAPGAPKDSAKMPGCRLQCAERHFGRTNRFARLSIRRSSVMSPKL